VADANQNQEMVLATISGRRSVRAFLDRPVSHRKVEEILAIASHAPSGSNNQPWRVHVLSGPAKARLSAAILAERAFRRSRARARISLLSGPLLPDHSCTRPVWQIVDADAQLRVATSPQGGVCRFYANNIPNSAMRNKHEGGLHDILSCHRDAIAALNLTGRAIL
jgi:nitroreductase